jgi:hypothetical protein
MTASQPGIAPPDAGRLHRQSHRVLSDRAGDGSTSGTGMAPAVGAVLMSASTIVVALNVQLLRRLDLRPQPALR